MVGVNEQTLLVVRRYFGKLPFRFIQSVFALKGPRFVVQNLCQQIIRLIFLGMLLDNLLEHLNGFAALVCQNETSGQFFARVGVIRLYFKYAQIKWNRFF